MTGPTPWVTRLRRVAPTVHYPHLPDGDSVVLDERRHGIVLALPAVRTLSGAAVVLPGARLGWALLIFLAALAWELRDRTRLGLRSTGLVVLAAAVALLVLASSARSVPWRVLLTCGLVGWLVMSVADWWADRMLVTRQRLYRLHGVLTTHKPSVALTGIAFIDVVQNPVGRLPQLCYGTIVLDSAAQHDDPLARFDHMHQPQLLHKKIVKLRDEAWANRR